MENTYTLPDSHWEITFVDKPDTDISYHDTVVAVLDFLTTRMITEFRVQNIPIGTIRNIPENPYPYCQRWFKKIFLDASVGPYWSQYAFQYAHELCHYLIYSGPKQSRDEWFEEVICECSSRYWLKQLATSNLLCEDSYLFKVYAILREQKIKKFEIKELQNENSEMLTYLRQNHESREHFNFLSNQIMPIIDDDPEIWSDMILLRTISDNFTFTENLARLTAQSDLHKESFERIARLFL